MGNTPPVVYLLHGDDDLAISQYVRNLQSKLGESFSIDINTTRLDGRVVSLEEIESAAFTLPFLAKRRVVILTHPLARLNSPASRQRFTTLLEKAPPSTALVLIEFQILTNDKDRKQNKLHWLEKWASGAGERVLLRPFRIPQGAMLVARVQEMAKTAGGQISPGAAELLVSLVGDHLPVLEQEIQKLVAYVNYQRQVEEEDVEHLTLDLARGDIFAMVDAMASFDGRRALDMLHRLLDEQDPISIFGMVIRQFRLLLQAREVLDSGGNSAEVTRSLKIHPYVGQKVSSQAQRFPLPVLENIYHRLLDMDLSLKTSEMEGTLALDTFIAGITHS